MKNPYLLISTMLLLTNSICAQDQSQTENDIQTLINKYVQARAHNDTLLLSSILTDDIDQLVSSGTWRRGKTEAMQGMLRSSTSNPGKRTIVVDQTKTLNGACAVADAKYEIENADGSIRRMWSTFICVQDKGHWKIAGIRNMLPPPAR